MSPNMRAFRSRLDDVSRHVVGIDENGDRKLALALIAMRDCLSALAREVEKMERAELAAYGSIGQHPRHPER